MCSTNGKLCMKIPYLRARSQIHKNKRQSLCDVERFNVGPHSSYFFLFIRFYFMRDSFPKRNVNISPLIIGSCFSLMLFSNFIVMVTILTARPHSAIDSGFFLVFRAGILVFPVLSRATLND